MPPGAPAAMFKTLEQVEPRIPVSAAGVTLSQSGSYYLTTNLVTSSTNTDCITISASDVTLDLNGFTIIGTGGTNSSADGVSYSGGGARNVTICNGTIRGFYRGIAASSAAANTGAIFENLRIVNCYFRGIILGVTTNTVSGIIRNNLIQVMGVPAWVPPIKIYAALTATSGALWS